MSRNSLSGFKAQNEGYYYEDDFLYFTFDDRYSKLYNLFIINEGDDLLLTSDNGASSSYESPLFGNTSFYQGTSNNQRTFTYNVGAGGLDLPRYREMMLWLQPGKRGFLLKDCDGYWGHDVVVDSIGSVSRYGSSSDFAVEFSITFKTIDSPYARPDTNFTTVRTHSIAEQYYVEGKTLVIINAYYTVESQSDGNIIYIGEQDSWGDVGETIFNEYGIPEILISKDGNKTYFTLPQVNNLFSYVDLGFERQVSDTSSAVSAVGYDKDDSSQKLLNISLGVSQEAKSWTYYGDSGLLLDENGFFDNDDSVESVSEPDGIVALECETPHEITEYTTTLNSGKLSISVDEIEYNNLYNKYGGSNSFLVISQVADLPETAYSGITEDGVSRYGRLFYNFACSLNEDIFDSENKCLTISGVKESLLKECHIYIGFCNKMEVQSSDTHISSITIHKYNNL